MFKKIVWKMFPPKKVTNEDVEMAHNYFDMVRNRTGVNGYSTSPYGVIETARNAFIVTTKNKLRYDEYLQMFGK